MTLHRKLIFIQLALVMGFTLTVGVAVWGLLGAQQGAELAVEEYTELRMLDQIRSHVDIAKGLLMAEPPEQIKAIKELRTALDILKGFGEIHHAHHAGGDQHDEEEISRARSMARTLEPLIAQMEQSGDTTNPSEMIQLATSVRNDLDQFILEIIDPTIARAQSESSNYVHQTTLVFAILGTTAILLGLIALVHQHQSVIRPLQSLREGIRSVRAAQFTERVRPTGDVEFQDLAREFNAMAQELEQLYQQLEEQVTSKTKELARSERLASIGHLAAGVAHELNNPLSIIATYAEMAIQTISKTPTEEALHEASDTLQTVHREAFRCKKIIEQLLALTRGGGEARTQLDINPVLRDVTKMISSIEKYRDKHLSLDLCDMTQCPIRVNEPEIKQVLINLIVNALEAVKPHEGHVRIQTRQVDKSQSISISIRDNGNGMDPVELQKIFEPFYTKRPNGTGLGLSISMAIVDAYGGRLWADSDGPGHGSTFTLELPLAKDAASG